MNLVGALLRSFTYKGKSTIKSNLKGADFLSHFLDSFALVCCDLRNSSLSIRTSSVVPLLIAIYLEQLLV